MNQNIRDSNAAAVAKSLDVPVAEIETVDDTENYFIWHEIAFYIGKCALTGWCVVRTLDAGWSIYALKSVVKAAINSRRKE